MMARRSSNVVASTPNGEITTEMILGYLALVSIPNKPVSAAKFKRTWMVHGLDEKLAPKTRRAVDVFMAACRSIESRRTDADRLNEIKVDRVMETAEECVYQITILVRDKDHKVIEHEKGMRLRFTANDETIRDEPLDDKKLWRELQQLAEVIREEYKRNASKVPGSKVRDAIRNTLVRDHATRIQNKGVYFVPKAARRTLEDIQGVIADLYGPTGEAEMAVLPVASDKAEKAMVKRHFESNVTDECDELMAEVSKRLKSETGLRADRQASMVAQLKEIQERTQRYEDTLDERSMIAREKVKLLEKGIEELFISASS